MKKKIFAVFTVLFLVFALSLTVSAQTADTIDFIAKDYCFGQGDNPNGADVQITGQLDYIECVPEIIDPYTTVFNLAYTIKSQDDSGMMITIFDHLHVIDDNIPLGQSTLRFVFKDGTVLTQQVCGLPHHDASQFENDIPNYNPDSAASSSESDTISVSQTTQSTTNSVATSHKTTSRVTSSESTHKYVNPPTGGSAAYNITVIIVVILIIAIIIAVIIVGLFFLFLFKPRKK